MGRPSFEQRKDCNGAEAETPCVKRPLLCHLAAARTAAQHLAPHPAEIHADHSDAVLGNRVFHCLAQ